MTNRSSIALVGILVGVLELISARPAAAGIRDRGHGIQLHVRPRRSNLVTIRWRVSATTARRSTKEYVFEYWTEDGWSSFLYTKQRTDHGIPVVARLPQDDNRSFCFRMVAVAPAGGDDEDGDDEGEIVGSGTSGNEGPCS